MTYLRTILVSVMLMAGGCAKDAAPVGKVKEEKSGSAELVARPEVAWGDVENGIRLGIRYVGSAQDRVLLELWVKCEAGPVRLPQPAALAQAWGAGSLVGVRGGESVLFYRGPENEEPQRSAYGYSVMTTRSMSSHQTMINPKDWGIQPGETVTIQFVLANDDPEADASSPLMRERFRSQEFRLPVWTGHATSGQVKVRVLQ